MSLVIASVLALCAAAAQRPTALERAGRYDEAAAVFERDLSRRPKDVDKQKDLMWAYWNGHRFEEARKTAERVLASRPGDPEALDVLREAAATDALKRAPALFARAASAYRAERFDEAVRLYEEVVAMQPRDVLSLRDLMWAFWRLDLIEESMEAARRILALRPADPEATTILVNGARILEERLIVALNAAVLDLIAVERFDAALTLLRRMVEMRPARIGYQRTIVDVLAQAGRLDEALAEVQALLRRFPRDAASWTTLGGIQVLMGDFKEARRSLEHALALDAGQRRAVLALAELLLRERDFAGAERLLRPWEDSSVEPMAKTVPWLLGQALFWQDRHVEALARFADAAEARPEKLERAFYHAWTLLKLGRGALGRAELAELSAKGHKASFAMLLDEAVVRGDFQRALALAEPPLREPQWSDEALVLLVAGLMQKVGRGDEALGLLTRFVEILPESQSAWLTKGSLELERGRMRLARRSAATALRINPTAREAALLRGRVASLTGNVARADRLARGVHRAVPMLPDNLLLEARTAYAAGDRRRARRLVEGWVERNEGTPLPVLLYHGLTTAETDPLLASPYHHSQRTFEEHMRAVKEAGYAPVTMAEAAAWLAGKGTLPPKPILITFDDGRGDSLRLGDPVLRRLGLKAAMMAGEIFVEGNPYPSPLFASWETLRAFRATGRWELESHGSYAHARIPVDARGRRGPFLVNRLPGETPEGRVRRVEREHAAARRRLASEFGREPIAFAYPEGAAGHTAAVSNAPDSFAVNRVLTAKHYQLAFVQDPSGVNTRGRDPRLLSRVEPDNRWSGEKLVRHLEEASPLAAAYALQLDWAARERDSKEAYRLLSKLESLGAGPSELLSKEAAIRYYAGDLDEALRLARRAEERDGHKEATALAQRIEAEDAPFSATGFQYYRDSQDRRTWALSQRFDLGRRGRFRPRAGYRRTEAAQSGGPVVVADVPGAGLDARLAPGHILALDAEGHLMRGAADAWAAEAAVGSLWPKGWSSRAGGSRTPLYAARALARGLHRRGANLSARWEGEPWAAMARARRDWYSDGNRRSTLEAEGSRRLALVERLTVRGVYRFVYDGARDPSDDYWTPRDLTLHALGPELSYAVAKGVALKGRWLAARGKESGGASGAYQQARAALTVGWRQLDALELAFDYSRAPRYRGLGASAQASVRLGP